MPEPDRVAVARQLLGSAEGDLAAFEALVVDENQADHVLGLLAQQAVEKATKAVLVALGRESPRTHDLGYLFELVAEARETLPHEVATGDFLAPWSGALRYDVSGAALDRAEATTAARAAVDWARTRLRDPERRD